MANANSRTRAAAPIPPLGGPQRPSDFDTMSSGLDQLSSVTELVAWIGRARDFIRGIETGRRLRPAFAQQVRDCDFGSTDVEWDEYVAEGLQALHRYMKAHLDEIGKEMVCEVSQ